MDTISVAVTRGGLVESVHRVHAVAVRDGRLVDAAGDPDLVTFMRSAAKPFQALSLAREHPDLPERELAIACASHEALPPQLAAVEALLARAGASEDDLECGPTGGSRLRHNCSGKHAGMLLRCRTNGWQTAGYRLPEHPLQRELVAEIAAAAMLSEDELGTGTDGCGVVAYALPLRAMAGMFSRLAREELEGAEAVLAAMRADPALIGGPGINDTLLMSAVPGTVAKRGAEGVLCAGLPDGTGVAAKVEDGANRAAGPALAAFLGLDDLRRTAVANSRGEEAGEIVANAPKSVLALSPGPS